MLSHVAAPAASSARSPVPRRAVRRAVPSYSSLFADTLMGRLRSGEHLILFGPRGAGKSTLLARMLDQYRAGALACAIAPETAGLADVVDAFSQAYPRVQLRGLNRRAMATRLRLTAERERGVLLLDHVRELTTAMIGFLRLLRGGVAGALLVVDVDSQFERERLLSWRRHALCVRMPLLTTRALRRLLLKECSAYALPAIEPAAAGQMVRLARGRVGWLSECVRHLRSADYWRDGRLHLAALCTDSEMAIRARRGPRLRAAAR
jgi:hypothetical protein